MQPLCFVCVKEIINIKTMEKIRTNEEMLDTLNEQVFKHLNYKLKEYKEQSKKYTSLYEMECNKVNFNIAATEKVLEYFNEMLEKFANGVVIETIPLPNGEYISREELNEHVYNEIDSQIYSFTLQEIHGTLLYIDLEIIRLKLFHLYKLKNGF